MFLRILFQNNRIISFTRYKSYKDTLNNPKFSLPIKGKILTDANDVYCSLAKNIKQGDMNSKFILHDGPPYANGDSHVGHALNKILKDVAVQYKRLQGYSVDFKPGWDCHGLPIEMKSINKTFSSPLDIRSNARTIASKYINDQKSAFKSWGISADWNNYYATYNFHYQSRELLAFQLLWEKNLIFRDTLPTFWSFSSGTALAEAELEYNKNHLSDSVFVKLQLNSDCLTIHQHMNPCLLIWTTTPWTLVANEAVGVREDIQYLLCQDDSSKESIILASFALDKMRQVTNKRLNVLSEISGNDLLGGHYRHPIIQGKTCSIIQASFVQEDKGTGLVHIAPAHGKEDFHLIKLRGQYESVFVSDDGNYTDICGKELKGLSVFTTGLEKIMTMLGPNLFHREQFTHSYPYDWRTKQPVIIRLSKQWFIDVDKLAKDAMNEYKKVKVFPPEKKSLMSTFIENRPNWCISRQRKWGVPIPVVYNEDNKVIVDKDFISYISERTEKEGSDFWWSENISTIIPTKFLEKWKCEYSQLKMSEDIFDIWFDSGLSWWCSMPPNVDIDVYMEGNDQFRGWFSSSLLTGVAIKGRSPYKNLVCHGFAVDSEGRKMSKSIGNVINPSDIVNKYGVDILRYWACSSGLNSQTSISHSLLDQLEAKYFFLRNMFRFILGNLSCAPAKIFHKISDSDAIQLLLPQDRYILHIIGIYVKKMESYFEHYKYELIINLLEELRSKISNYYFTLIKDRLYCESPSSEPHESCIRTLALIFHSLISVSLPMFPCLTLECIEASKKSNVSMIDPLLQWPDYTKYWIDVNLAESFENKILSLKNDINNINFKDLGIDLSHKTNVMNELSVEIFFEDNQERKTFELFNNHSNEWEKYSSLTEILRCASVKISDKNPLELNSNSLVQLDGKRWAVEFTKRSLEHKCGRCLRYVNINGGSEICSRCQDVVNSLADKESSQVSV